MVKKSLQKAALIGTLGAATTIAQADSRAMLTLSLDFSGNARVGASVQNYSVDKHDNVSAGELGCSLGFEQISGYSFAPKCEVVGKKGSIETQGLVGVSYDFNNGNLGVPFGVTTGNFGAQGDLLDLGFQSLEVRLNSAGSFDKYKTTTTTVGDSDSGGSSGSGDGSNDNSG